MSANFQKNDVLWILSMVKKGVLTKEETTILDQAFDSQTDYDVGLINKELTEIKLFKKICVLKLLTAPLESPLSLLLFGKDEWTTHKKLITIYYNFLMNKITYIQFKNNLQNLSKPDTIV